ncbi:MAG: peptidylprolyl isomerase [Bacilli bacterium]
MKKSKLSLSLVSGFIAALAMSSCSNTVTSSKDSIVSFEGYNGETISLITNEMYEQYRNTSDGITKFYNAIMEAIIRYEFKSGELAGKTESSYATIVKDAEKNVKGEKDKARSNAETNGTSYSTEWDAILESNGVESEKELLEKFIYQLEKEEVEDWYYEENKNQLRKEYIGIDDTGNAVDSDVSSSLPYHIRHVLVKLASGSSEFARSSITSTEAKNLATVALELANGKNTFGNVAYTRSEDDSSAVNFGDLGIMDLDTSFVNEFKLGIYAYDAILSRDDASRNDTINAQLGLDGTYSSTTVGSKVENIGLQYVPYEVFTKIGEVAETEKDDEGNVVNDGNSAYYPRNIYFNKYLNLHNPFVISNNKVNTDALNGQNGVVDTTVVDAPIGKTGWRYVEGVCTSLDQRVLTDENGHVIIGVRSEHGIHFMVMQQSIYNYSLGGETTEVPSLEEYYTTAIPGEDEYPTYTVGDKTYDKLTYVNFINTNDKSTLKERASTIENSIKSFDSTYEYRLYEFFVGQGKITFNATNGVNLGDQIQSLIDSTREYNEWNDAKSLNDSWRTYLELIELQYDNRTEKRLVPETCAIGFNDPDSPLYQPGGVCYVKK